MEVDPVAGLWVADFVLVKPVPKGTEVQVIASRYGEPLGVIVLSGTLGHCR